MDYQEKYLKYKSKYFDLKQKMQQIDMKGGASVENTAEIYLFKADWCPHCRAFKSTWDKLSSDLKSKYKFITVDADKDEDLIKKWNVQGFPTIIKKSGKNAVEYVGPRDEQSVKEFIQTN